MIRRFMYLFLTILATTSLSGKELSIEAVNPPQNPLRPGTSHTFVFKVLNNSKTDVECTSTLELPNNWITLTNENAFKLKDGQQDIRLISIYVPTNAAPGEYEIKYRLDTDNKTEVSGVSVVVEKVSKLNLKLFESPQYTLAGDRISATFNLKNEGNTTETIVLYPQNCLLSGEPVVALSPGSVKVVTVFLDTNKDITKMNPQFLKLEAAVEQNENEQVRASAYSQVDVYPVEERQNDAFFRFPIRLSGGIVGRKKGDESQVGALGEFSGGGFLDKELQRRLDFRFFGPNHFNMSVLGRYDEYYVRYKSSNLSLIVGDNVFKSTPLSEYSRYGRGVEFAYSFGNLNVGGFWQQPRFYSAIDQEYGTFIGFNVNKSDAVQANFFRKKTAVTGESATLYSVTGKKKLFSRFLIETEFSHGELRGRTGNGLMIKSKGRIGELDLAFQYLFAGKNYPGYYSNTKQYSANLNYSFNPKFNVTLNIHKDAINPKQDTLFGMAPASTSLRLGINWKYSPKGTLFFYGGNSERQDQISSNLFHYKEIFIKGGILQKTGHLSFSPDITIARTDNLLTRNSGQSYNFDFDLDYVRRWGMAGLFFSWQNSSKYDDNSSSLFYYGARMNIVRKENTTLSFHVQNNYSVEESFRNRNLFMVKLKQKITRGQYIDLACNYFLLQKQNEKKDLAVSLQYVLQLNVPLKRIAGYGELHGIVTGAEGRPVQGIRLYCSGHSVITDENGAYKFKNLVTGEHYLLVDQTTIGISVIPTISQPMEVLIKPGQNSFSFGMTLSSKISGHIFFKNAGDPLEKLLEEDNHVEGHVIVEISNGETIKRKLVSLNEDFIFDNLRPGEWKVSVYRNGLGEGYRVEESFFNVVLKQGEEVTVDATVVKTNKTILFMQDKIIVSGN